MYKQLLPKEHYFLYFFLWNSTDNCSQDSASNRTVLEAIGVSTPYSSNVLWKFYKYDTQEAVNTIWILFKGWEVVIEKNNRDELKTDSSWHNLPKRLSVCAWLWPTVTTEHLHRGSQARSVAARIRPFLYCAVLYCTVLYCTVLYCTVLHCHVLHCIVLHSNVFFHSPVSRSLRPPRGCWTCTCCPPRTKRC